MKNLNASLAPAGIAILLGLLALTKPRQSPQASMNFEVTLTSDESDLDGGDGACFACTAFDSNGNCVTGGCTLRAAIQQVNSTGSGSLTITFAVPEVTPTSLLPPISSSTTINGQLAGGGRAVVNGSSLGGVFPRILSFANGSGGSVVKNLEVFGAGGNAIEFSDSPGSRVEGCYLHDTQAAGVAFWDSHGSTVGGETDVPGTGLGNVISSNGGNGILIQSSSNGTSENYTIKGNLIGTNQAGTAAMGNGTGIRITGTSVSGTVIGGTEATSRNVISGNDTGIRANGEGVGAGSGVAVQGNFIGTDITGRNAIGNERGVRLEGVGHVVGGPTTGARNIISGNSRDGVSSSSADLSQTVIQGNYIGTDVDGMTALPNGTEGFSRYGISLSDAQDNQILENLISGNGGIGILLSGTPLGPSTGNVIDGNLIGTDVTGQLAISNLGHGLMLNGAGDNTVGSNTGNVISGNMNAGVLISGGMSQGNVLQKNYIGTNGDLRGTGPKGDAAVPNQEEGVAIEFFASNTTIGSQVADVGNVIAYNGTDGVRVVSGTGNRINQNSIHDNDGLGINLDEDANATTRDEVTANDEGDVDDGANKLQNRPAMAFRHEGGSTIVEGTLASTPETTFRVEVFSNTDSGSTEPNEGETFQTTIDVTTDSDGSGSFTLTLQGELTRLTATATDPDGNTSEFSHAASLAVNSTGDLPDSDPGDGLCDTGQQIERDGEQEAECTLRAAIGEANESEDDDIAFNIPVSDAGFDAATATFVIRPASPLPSLSRPVTIDGRTQAGGAIRLHGGDAGDDTSGLTLSAGSSKIQKIMVTSFGRAGLRLEATGGNTILGCHVGTTSQGEMFVGNRDGIVVVGGTANVIGGVGTGDGNVIAGNTVDGLRIESPAQGTMVLGNHIGTDSDGRDGLGHARGINIAGSGQNEIGGLQSGAGNVIAFNDFEGVLVDGSMAAAPANRILANRIGTDLTGDREQGNGAEGIKVTGDATGTVIEDNYVTDNGSHGVLVEGADEVLIRGNRIGGASDRGNDLNGVFLRGGATDAEVDANVLSGNSSYGLSIEASNGHSITGNLIGTDDAGEADWGNLAGILLSGASDVTIGGSGSGEGNVVSGSHQHGVVLENGSADNTVAGNVIGLVADGSSALPNDWAGVVIRESSGNVVGGTQSGAGNIISGNGDGLYLIGQGTAGTRVEGNTIGLDREGTAKVPNTGDGIVLLSGAHGNTIGGTDAGSGNTVSGNDATGIVLRGSDSQMNTIAGNRVGLARTGNEALGNGEHGIHLEHASDNTVGGTATSARNYISGNAKSGVAISGSFASDNTVLGNYIGVAADGLTARGNEKQGVYVYDGANENTIGGTEEGARNVISGNGSRGVFIVGAESTHNSILGNYIGVDMTGVSSVGNLSSGIVIRMARHTMVGGVDVAARNVLSGNGGHGVHIEDSEADSNRVLGNYIGVAASGSGTIGNVEAGVFVQNSGRNFMGGTAAGSGNVIGGNGGEGVAISGQMAAADSNRIYRNLIGILEDGTSAGNEGDGISITEAPTTLIGDGSTAGSNTVAHNEGSGVAVSNRIGAPPQEGPGIRRNSIFQNGGLGIDYAPFDQESPIDATEVSLRAPNYPFLESLVVSETSQVLYGTMVGVAPRVYTVELYLNPNGCDDSGFGEGKIYLASQEVSVGAEGRGVFSFTLPAGLVGTHALTATARAWPQGTSEFSRCFGRRTFRIVDALSQPVSNRMVEISRARFDIPRYTEIPLGTYTTDAQGEVSVLAGLSQADSVKVKLSLHSEPSIRGGDHFDTSYTLTLDNGRFHEDRFTLTYDRVGEGLEAQEIVLGHSTVGFNLLFSIEWDASREYLFRTQDSFRNLVNHLYDVFDGQVRLDTVVVKDDKEDFDLADGLIRANNLQWPKAWPAGFFRVDRLRNIRNKVKLPRRYFGKGEANRLESAVESPLNPADPAHYRALGHELGHYIFGFDEEYRFRGTAVLPSSVPCQSRANYGFMDDESPAGGEASSETSWARTYAERSCQNTWQWTARIRAGGSTGSTWAQFSDHYEGLYEGIWFPIVKPDERNLDRDREYYEGPNNGLPGTLDVDVGRHVVFPIPPSEPFASSRSIRVLDAQGRPLTKVKVFQVIPQLDRRILQGVPADDGTIVILGASAPDRLEVEGAGFAVIDLPGKAAVQADYTAWFSGETELGEATDVLHLRRIAGDLPAIAGGRLTEAGFDYSLTWDRSLIDVPSLQMMGEDQSQVQLTDFDRAGSVYTAFVVDPPGVSGRLRTIALDDSSRTFFFTNAYSMATYDPEETDLRIRNRESDIEVVFDTLNVDIARALVISSSYPPLRGGLAEGQVLVGRTHTLDVSPSQELLGLNELVINYAEVDLTAVVEADAEDGLLVYRWGAADGRWDPVGGQVDPYFNSISVPISSSGTYAAFTRDTTIRTSIEREAPVGRFKLHQNYPNPVLAETTFIMDVPYPALVRLRVFDILGREVALVLNERLAKGRHQVVFDAAGLSSGVYLYEVEALGFRSVRPLMVVR